MPEDPILTLLFICTHNRCRSILCEALARDLGQGQLVTLSAGSQPVGNVHPDTLKHLQARGIDTASLHSKSWDEHEDAPIDAVITVCDSAAGESCPAWFGRAQKVHWGLPDPSKIEDQNDRSAAFEAVIATIERRIGRLLEHDLNQLTDAALCTTLQKIAAEDD